VTPGGGIPAMILLIDNYDSFTWNLVQRLGEIAPGVPLDVRRNDRIDCDAIAALGPSHVVISPGPCTPDEAGMTLRRVPTRPRSLPFFHARLSLGGGIPDAWKSFVYWNGAMV
jgi:anthranilate/para-aminobenzoate synthase component II